MAKVDEWRKKVDEWKVILNQPKNAGLKIGGTGVSEALRKVGDAEMDFAKGKEPGKNLVEAFNDLLKALGDLITLCKSTSDKHKSLFTTACKHLDGVRDAAIARRNEATREVDDLRKAVGDRCAEAIKHLKVAKDLNELGAAWRKFVADFELHGKGFPTLKAHIGKAKEQKLGGALEAAKAELVNLAQTCQTATLNR
jgi:hypothetical protein